MHLTLRFYLIIVIFTILNLLSVNSQEYPFENYTVKNGLPSNLINKALQDKKGYIWFATQGGLTRFDGYKFKNIDISKGLPSNEIRDICIDEHGTIWILTPAGLARLKDEKVDMLEIELPLSDIKEIKVDRNGNLWMYDDENLYLLKENKIVSIKKYVKDFNYKAIKIFLFDEDIIWCGSTNGFFCISLINNKPEILKAGLEGKIIKSIFKDSKNNYWISTENNGLYFSKNGVIFHEYKLVDKNYIILDISEDLNENIWFATFNNGVFYITKDNKINYLNETRGFSIKFVKHDMLERTWIITQKQGIFLYEKDKITYLTNNNGLIDNTILNLFIDKENNLWFCTLNGISKFSKKPFIIYSNISKDIVDVVIDKNKNIWMGTYGDLIKYNINKGIERFTNVINDVHERTVTSLLLDEDDLWIGTNLGLMLLRNNKITTVRNNLFIYNLCKDKIGNLWLAHDQGISKYDGKKFTDYNSKNGLSTDECYTIAIDKYNNVWIGTTFGLNIFDGKTFKYITTKNGLSNNIINDICIVEDTIWVATEYGLNKINIKNEKITIKKYFTEHGLCSNNITLLKFDNKQNLWIGTNKGLDKFNLVNNQITHYGIEEGFTPLETYSGAVAIDSNNDIWFGTGEGLVQYKASWDYISNIPPVVYITGVSLFNDTTNILKYADGLDSITKLPLNLELPYNKNNLIFEFIALHYNLPAKNAYKYKLEGYDDNWSEITYDTKSEPYRKLPPGSYTFMVLASNSDGLWINEPVKFTFTIKPPFWQTLPAYLIEIILFVLLIYFIVKFRERKLIRDKKILEEKVRERTIEIEKQRDQIARQNKEITDSILYAKRIQSAILPEDTVISNCLKEYFILYKPRDIVSGDFYWITKKENLVYVVCADCTGHGVPGAFMSMLGVSLLNEIVKNSQNHLKSSDILNKLRELVKTTLAQKGRDDEAKDGMDMVLAIIDFEGFVLQFSGAYNQLWIYRDNEVFIYKGDKMPIGIYPGTERPFSSIEIDLKKNDIIYMFTDGYVDQFGGPEGKKIKTSGLKDIILKIANLPMEQQKQFLDDYIEEWKGENQQVDDILVMGIKII